MKTYRIWIVRLKWTIRRLKRIQTGTLPRQNRQRRLIRLCLKGIRLLILVLKLAQLIRELFRMIARGFQSSAKS